MNIPKEWPSVRQRNNSSSWIVDGGIVDKKRKRQTVKTKAEADALAKEWRKLREQEGRAGLEMTTAMRISALHNINKLKALGVELSTAVDDFIKFRLPSFSSKLIKEIAADLVQSAKANNPKWGRDLERMGNHFCASFGERKPGDLTASDLNHWLATMKQEYAFGPRSLKNYRDYAFQVIREGKLPSELLKDLRKAVPKPEGDGELPGIFTLAEVRALLLLAPNYDLLPYLSVRLYAGVRHCEAMRLGWDNVRQTCLDLTAKQTRKTKKMGRARRTIQISDTLAAWLDPFRGRTGQLAGTGAIGVRWQMLKKAAGITRRTQNTLRHSFATYHLAAYGDSALTSSCLGHVDTEMLHSVYKGREVEKEQGQDYFKLRPETVFPDGVIPPPSGCYVPGKRRQPTKAASTGDGTNPWPVGTIAAALFEAGSKEFMEPLVLVAQVAKELEHSPAKVRTMLYIVRNLKHQSNRGRSMAQRSGRKIRLISLLERNDNTVILPPSTIPIISVSPDDNGASVEVSNTSAPLCLATVQR